MKKTKRLAVLLAAVLACGTMAFSACSNGNNDDDNGGDDSGIIDNNNGNNNDTGNNDVGIQVTKEEWIERFAMLDNCDNMTLYEGGYSLYPKNEAEEYGYWFSGGGTMLFDFKSQIRCDIFDFERYDPDDINAVNGFVKDSHVEYTFYYNNHYFTWREDEGIDEMSQEDFLYNFENMKYYILSRFALYASEEYYEKAKYNAQTNIYELELYDEDEDEQYTLSIQFLKNAGIKFPIKDDESYGEDIIYNINSTTVTVPAQAYKDADEYLANNAE